MHASHADARARLSQISRSLPFRNPYFQARLDNEKGRMILQLSVWMYQLEAVVAEKHRQRLVHLEERQVLADAQVSTAAKLVSYQHQSQTQGHHSYLEHVSLHRLRVTFKPSFRSENVCILAESFLVAVQDPSIDG